MAAQGSLSRMYSDIEPRCEWVQGDDFNTLLVDVAGFKKEELKAQVDTSRNLKISGERNVEGNKWCRFQKSFQLPKECEISKIKAKFDHDILYVTVPKPSAVGQTPRRDGNGTTAATVTDTTSMSKQDASEIKGTPFKENNGYSQEGDGMQPVRGVARNLIKHKLVILNVVIAAILLALVLFRRYKAADGDDITDLTTGTIN